MHIIESKFPNLKSPKSHEIQCGSRINHLELKVLHKVSQLAGQALNLNEALENILGILAAELPMKRGAIAMIDSDTGQLVIRASIGLTTREMRTGGYWFEGGITEKIFSSNTPFAVPDVTEDPLYFKHHKGAIEETGLSFVGVPIALDHRAIGVISVDRLFDKNTPIEEDVEFLFLVADFVAQLISLNKQVRESENSLVRSIFSLKEKISEKSRAFFSSARSSVMSKALQQVKDVARTSTTPLIMGEFGTGKTLVAQIIHELSPRSKSPFIKVNCAALPGKLLEAELFGYEKGSFPGAAEARIGRVEECDGGTLFLYEIGKMPAPVQAKLFRYLQDKEFERRGNLKIRKVDTRIIAATHGDLAGATAAGEFRQDLYHSLSVFPILIPPLRQRREDIVGLLSFFTQFLAKENEYKLRFSRKATETLIQYAWPGNVKEMENLLERLTIIFQNGLIDVEDLTPYISYNLQNTAFESEEKVDCLTKMEKRSIVAALQRNNWNQSRAARELGITLRQMGYRVKKFGLEHFLKEKKTFI